MSKVSIIGKANRVADMPDLTIDELAGRVATKSNLVSVAHVHAKKGRKEPFLHIQYDEWICILNGKMLFECEGDEITGNAGDTILIKKNTRFRPSFLEDTEYIPVCLPAFSPDLCTREDDTDAENVKFAENLKKLHADQKEKLEPLDPKKPEVLYHMTTKAAWEQAERNNCAYFPETFEKDGYFTHATAIPGRLMEVANCFYQDVEGEWICLEFRRSVLSRKYGIVTKDEAAMPVGDKDAGENIKNETFPHVYAGLPCGCVDRIYKVKRDGPKFISIEGLTD